MCRLRVPDLGCLHIIQRKNSEEKIRENEGKRKSDGVNECRRGTKGVRGYAWPLKSSRTKSTDKSKEQKSPEKWYLLEISFSRFRRYMPDRCVQTARNSRMLLSSGLVRNWIFIFFLKKNEVHFRFLLLDPGNRRSSMNIWNIFVVIF